jgi:hypothetical protein
LSAPAHRSKRFNPLSDADVKGIELELGDEPANDWAEVDIELTTYAGGDAPDFAGGKRWGVFFGVSDFEFDAEHREASGRSNGLNLTVCHRDAQTFGRYMLDSGRLNGAKIFTNADATRANLEEMVTQWLPSVSRPGDTVFIFFSSHCTQIPDDNGDESDGQDEVILPHDFVGPSALEVLLKKYQNNELPDWQRGRLEQLVASIRASGLDPAQAVMRETGVSDDLFGRWLQRLSGRQVVVMLDTCHSGGFDAQEKAFSTQAAGFDFLDGEMLRLKDIGQRDQALLASSALSEVSFERVQSDLGVFTYYLLEALKGSPGAVRIENALEGCQQGMAQYFEERNAQREADGQDPIPPQHPQLMNHCVQPIFLKL